MNAVMKMKAYLSDLFDKHPAHMWKRLEDDTELSLIGDFSTIYSIYTISSKRRCYLF